MSQTNTRKTNINRTHEGGPAKIINVRLQLQRSVMACLLWENSFYEDGVDISARIVDLVHRNTPQFVAKLAIEARTKMKLRHVPLLLVRELCRHNERAEINLVSVIDQVIQRADELSELLSLYWKDGRTPLSAQLKKGLAKAFLKFSEYDLAKYNRDNAVKLRDVLFLTHAKPTNKAQRILFKKLVDNNLAVPDTWEVALSAGKDKKATWTRLLKEKQLGALALLRNLRNMNEVGVEEELVKQSLREIKVDRVLPYRFISAARYAPHLEPELEEAMLKCLETQEKMEGKTALLIDVSGSMDDHLSAKSEMTRIDAACGLAVLLREICADVKVYTFSEQIAMVPARRGFALRDAITTSQKHGGTHLGAAVAWLNKHNDYERIIVITDEQSSDPVQNPKGAGYMINVASYQNGVGYGSWTNITGFSESIVQYIRELEKKDGKDTR